jgi:hypothetical protein
VPARQPSDVCPHCKHPKHDQLCAEIVPIPEFKCDCGKIHTPAHDGPCGCLPGWYRSLGRKARKAQGGHRQIKRRRKEERF